MHQQLEDLLSGKVIEKPIHEECDDALRQINEKGYDSWLPEEGYREVWHYGISFFKKQCQVKVRHKYF